MKKLIHENRADLGCLRCDNPACGHVLPEPLPWGPALIGYPCPRCSSDMLTRKDFEIAEKMHRVIAGVNRWFGWLGTEEPAPTDHVAIVDIKGGRVTTTREKNP